MYRSYLIRILKVMKTITDKKLYNEPTTVTIDCGQLGATIYDGNKQRKAVKIPFEDLFNLPNMLPKGSSIWGERAHYGVPQVEKSLAQYFTSEVLLKFYADVKTMVLICVFTLSV